MLKGAKQASCMRDDVPAANYPLTRPPKNVYTCDFQGLSAGLVDRYANGLDCQFIDITGVAPGRYTLRVSVNPDRVWPELRYDNNVVDVPVDIPKPVTSPTEPCMGRVATLKRECGWTKDMTGNCTPGTMVTVGCGRGGLGTRTGEPMIRVCSGSTACAHPGLGNNDIWKNKPMDGALVTFTCPASGLFTVMTAAHFSDNATTTCKIGRM